MKQRIILIIITVGILLAGIGGSFYVLHHHNEKKIAEIYQNNVLYTSIDLSQVEEPYELTITGENGESNVIFVEKNQISMESASCPDKVCVNQGKISDGLLPIVCLPNHIRISIVGDAEEEESEYDVQVY